MKSSKVSLRSAFTLVELIIVIAIIAILAAAIFVGVDPARRLHEARNARRTSDVASILEAIKKYQVDHDGDLTTDLAALTTTNYYVIGTCGSGAACTDGHATLTLSGACYDMSADDEFMDDGYLGAVPQDPKDGSAVQTKYYLAKSANGSLTVGACEPEQEGPGGSTDDVTIELTR